MNESIGSSPKHEISANCIKANGRYRYKTHYAMMNINADSDTTVNYPLVLRAASWLIHT